MNIIINGQPYEVEAGESLLHAAQKLGIHIPALCDHPDLSPYSGCRLCDVEVKDARMPLAACSLIVSEGMEILTETPALEKARRHILELLLANYYDAGYPTNHHNALIELCRKYDVPVERFAKNEPRHPVNSDPNPFLWVDLNKCILCNRCIRACAEIQGRSVWGLSNRGFESRIVAGADVPLLEARCESCGACATYCPTGALDNMPSMQLGEPDRRVMTTCAYCGVGCQFELLIRQGRVIGVASKPEAPVNGMHLCVKGRYGYDYVHHADRLTQPRVRQYLLDGTKKTRQGDAWNWVDTDWDTAMRLAAEKLFSTRESSGEDSIGILSSAKCTNEENYLMNKFARQVIGTNNIDHCARLCHSSTVAGLAASFGSGAMTNSMDDLAAQAELIFVTGSNTTEQHPVFGSMLRQAVRKRNARLIVADPRRIDLCDFATLHLQMKSGTDIALLNGLMNIILENGWEDRAFIEARTEGFEDFAANLANYTPKKVETITGVPVAQLQEAARLLGTTRPAAVVWAMGITQHIVGVQNVQTLANLQMLLGNMGKPGSGVNPLRGQNNVQGACDMGGLPNVYPAYQPVIKEEVRMKFAQAWGTDLNPTIGLTVTEMIPAAESGKIKGLYILGEDPVLSDPDSNHVRKCLEKLDFMILQEIFPSETSEYADILLPGASFAEKDGTFTNTERRVQLVRQAIDPPGDARQDWQITSELARRVLSLGTGRINADADHGGWEYQSPSQIMDEINALAPSYAGVIHARLEQGERLQWPVKDKDHGGTPILHQKEFTRGKGLFNVTQHIPPAELPDSKYPFLMNTGRVLYHWHGGELTRRAEALNAIYPRSLVEINPEDARRLNIETEATIRVASRRGWMQASAWITDRVPPGMVFTNFHFPDSPANALTIAALDPVAKIPDYKVTAVKIEKVE